MVGSLADHIAIGAMNGWDSRWRSLHLSDLVALIVTIISLGLFSYTRREDRDRQFILNLGQGYLILTCLALGIVIHSDVAERFWKVFLIITWVGVVLIMFAAIIPSTPGKTLVVGIVAPR